MLRICVDIIWRIMQTIMILSIQEYKIQLKDTFGSYFFTYNYLTHEYDQLKLIILVSKNGAID